MPINVKKSGVKVNGRLTVEPDGENWILMGNGSGKVVNYKGKGAVIAVRVATGVKTPELGDQIKGGLEAIFGGPPDAGTVPKKATEGGKLKPPDPPAQVEQVEEASSLLAGRGHAADPRRGQVVGGDRHVGHVFVMFGFFVFI